jgi:hypothetical protein
MSEPAPLALLVSVRRCVVWLAFAIATLVAANLAVRFYLYFGDHSRELKSLRMLSLAAEQSLGAWFSSLLLMAAATLCFVIAAGARRRRESFAGHWLVLGIVFVGLSIDEAVSMHELLNPFMRSLLDIRGWLRYAWLIPGALFALGFGVAYLPFLRAIRRPTAVRFVLSGAIFVAGAVGCEMIDSYLSSAGAYGAPSHILASTLEETLEMVGATLFLRALLLEIGLRSAGVTLDIEAA